MQFYPNMQYLLRSRGGLRTAGTKIVNGQPVHLNNVLMFVQAKCPKEMKIEERVINHTSQVLVRFVCIHSSHLTIRRILFSAFILLKRRESCKL
jgi:hypothetical protein